MTDSRSPSFAILAHGDAYSTAGKIMGRQAAGEGFIRGVARTWPQGQLDFVMGGGKRQPGVEELLRSKGFSGQTRWSGQPGMAGAKAKGALYHPGPLNVSLARLRNRLAPAAFSIFGVTHTLSTDRTLDALSGLVLPPYRPWDALICTSRAARAVVQSLFEDVEEEHRRTLGVQRFTRVQLPVIPLGVHCDDPPMAPDQKAQARAALGIADDEVAVLFAGRLAFHSKVNPGALYQALQAISGEAKLVCVEAGIFPNDYIRDAFQAAQQALAPDVRFIHAAGGKNDLYTAAWRAADIFTSLSDNLQETFGLTPVEAMAAGLPVVATDWNGYRDNIRHGLDGFLIPTLSLPPGAGQDMTLAVETSQLNYDRQIGLASHGVVVERLPLEEALRALATNADLRRRMGESGRQHARRTFDWPVVLRAYDDLCAELAQLRAAGQGEAAESWPQREDLLRRFASFPTRFIAPGDQVRLARDGAGQCAVMEGLNIATFTLEGDFVPRAALHRLIALLEEAGGPQTVATLLASVGGASPANQRALAWLAKFRIVEIAASMKVLFIHQNFPGQYKHLAPKLAAMGHRVRALTVNVPRFPTAGVDVTRYAIKRGTTKDIHPWAADFETKIIRGEACARAMRTMKDEGFEPDIILAHPGWGEAMFAREVFPAAKQLYFVEYFYRSHGQDVNFDKEFEKRRFDDDARTIAKTANSLMALEAMDWGVSPTEWQRAINPSAYRDRISVIHDGVDTKTLRPDPQASLTLPDGGPTFRAGEEIVTFVNRNLEPLRGFHSFMRALPAVQAARPNAQILIVGGEQKGYGGGKGGWKERMLQELGDRIDRSRIHFLGNIAYDPFVRMLQVSRVHIYLSYPFVLSWSMIEAMSVGCCVIGGATAPVREVITDGETGLLVDFFDTAGLAEKITAVLAAPQDFDPIRRAARALAVERYDLETVCLPAQVELIGKVARGELAAD